MGQARLTYHSDTGIEQAGGEGRQCDGVDDARHVGHSDQEFARRLGVDVGLVNVIGPDRRDGDQLRRRRRSHRHEDQQQRS